MYIHARVISVFILCCVHLSFESLCVFVHLFRLHCASCKEQIGNTMRMRITEKTSPGGEDGEEEGEGEEREDEEREEEGGEEKEEGESKAASDDVDSPVESSGFATFRFFKVSWMCVYVRACVCVTCVCMNVFF